MSFILDALRKSERERQSRRAPGIADMQRGADRKTRSIWLPLAALLAGLNIALLGLLWYSAGDSDTRSPAIPAQVSTTAPAAGMPHAISGDRSLSEQLAVEEMSSSEEPARYAAIVPPDVITQPGADDIEIPPTPSAGRMPTVTEALLDGSLNIRPLHLDIHVYSEKAAERFVFINTARYSEGDRTAEGPTVATINQEGVVLSYQGRDYLLTRE